MPHSLMMILCGLILLTIMVSLQKGGRAKGAMRFIPIWLVISAVNMAVGVYYAGYSWGAEITALLPIFAVPAIAALLVARLLRS